MSFLNHGGPFLFALFIVAFAVVFISIERIMQLYSGLRFDSKAFFRDLKKFVEFKQFKEALDLCRTHPEIPITRIMEVALMKRRLSVDEMRLSIEAESLQQKYFISQRIQLLPSLANIAVLLGLVGTVMSFIRSFSTLGVNVVADISDSMLTTAVGLAIAAVAIIMHLVLSSKILSFVSEFDLYSLEIQTLLAAQKIDPRDLKVTQEFSIPLALRESLLETTEILDSRVSKTELKDFQEDRVTRQADLKK